ncbi:SHOCT domain-containing protein [Nocardioides guangzhouensis]|uniref:SHOCT domain-containing protein n=1 Tax=Nocardioides guangzhouensis TaxID=2497878 RepID=A0A4V1XYR3_9ACTN|nr:SHOCT domain-containing protein [Nocardioides guangzhouensis]RYP84149.1 SHOCT domain-containing protein [Nocardioides guangzhouensis]
MLLVPRQLRRAGMTGDVPYYGGRFTPAQAYAASHPRRPAPPPPPPPTPPTQAQPGPPAEPRPDPLPALHQLYDSGVITRDEYHQLLERVGR